MNNLELFKRVDFLTMLSDNELLSIAHLAKEVTYYPGDVIFAEKDPGDSFYIIKSGEVELIKKVNIEKTAGAELRALKPYEYFGEMSLIDDSSRSATAKVSMETTLLKIEKSDFLRICLIYPKVILQLSRTMSSRLRETNERFIQMWDSLLKKNKMAAIGSAASKIVHDIKTPITIIVLTAQIIGKMFPDTEKYADKIVNQTRVLDEMVREILDFARGEQSVLNIQKVKIAEFFQNLYNDLAPIAEDKEIKIILDNTIDGTAYFDPQKIKRAFTNIIKNAIEALNRLGEIRVIVREESKKMHIIIADNGPGIPDEILEKIFEPFVTKGKSGGTGLGMAICHKVITDHNGSIEVENQKNGGAKFDIHLPI